MADEIKRKEETHINEVQRTATSTVQWFAELRNKAGEATHPITHNNRLQMFICGEDSFADIAKEIKKAQESIDLCCWGFDPGMELVRDSGATWPRGETYGDLLIDAGRRGVKVRLLIWYDVLGSNLALNMPGYTHGTYPWCYREQSYSAAKEISAVRSLRTLNKLFRRQLTWQEKEKERIVSILSRGNRGPIGEADIPMLAREEYCFIWYKAAMAGQLENIQIATRLIKKKDVAPPVNKHDRDFPDSAVSWIEREGLYHVATHHQKPIVIDFAYNEGRKAVGYVMGLNSVTDYWDTGEHLMEDPKRERGGKREAEECVQEKKKDPGFQTLKPYRDYACRLDGGGALVAVHRNFVSAWARATVLGKGAEKEMAIAERENREGGVPPALKRAPQPGDCSVQIVRTQPQEQDFSIKEVYFQATDIATMAAGYLYIETQYFQYEAWSRRLMDSRERVVKRWKLGCAKAGKCMEDMPVMHVFIVIPVPERQQMVPRTYDALAVLGQHEGMTGQQQMIDNVNNTAAGVQYDAMGNATGGNGDKELDDVVRHANEIDKPTIETLRDKFRMKISVAMLNTCASQNGRWRYREIYIHSKLMLVDDTFMTIGSANLNLRSMNVDSEINLATVNPEAVKRLRTEIWNKISGEVTKDAQMTHAGLEDCHSTWTFLMRVNKAAKKDGLPMMGFLLPLSDDRPSNIRLG